MAVLGRVLISSSERLDLPDLLSVDSYAAGDWKYFLKGLVGDSKPYILKGFDVIDPLNAIGTQSCSIRVADSMVFYPESSSGGFYHGLAEGHVQAAPLVPELRKNAVNYVYLTFSTFNSSVDTRAFWDPDKDGGNGGEFTQDVNTESVLKVDVNVSVGSFPANTIPIALVTVGPVTITAIEDARDMMFRLGSGGINPDPFNGYAWRSLPGAGFTRTEPPTQMLAGGTNPFQGADKNILSLKEWMDAVMMKLRELGGTSYWYEDASTFSLISSFIDSNATAFRSKGKWSHSSVTAGVVTWTEDINIKVVSDPRTYIVREGNKTLLDEQVMYIPMIRDGILNATDDVVDWTNAQPYVNTVGGAVGLFVNLAKGDYVKKINDSNDKYLRVEEFYDTINLGGVTTTAANAKSIRLSGNYLGTTTTEKGRYDKGVYAAADVVVSDRDQLAIQAAGGNFHWMAMRSDTIESVSNITTTTLTLAISEHDGATAKCTSGAVHGLVDGDRVTISGSTNFDGTYTVEVESTTIFYINIPGGPFADEAARIGRYATVTSTTRSTAYGLQLESANHGFASNEKIIIAGTTNYNASYLISVRDATTFTIPVSAANATETAGTATLAKVILRTEGSVVQVVQGGSASIGGTPAENIRIYVGMESLSDTTPTYVIPPNYNTLDGMQNYNALTADNLTVRAAKLTAMMADKAQDKTIKLMPSGYNAVVNTLNGASRDITFTATPPSGVPLLDIALPSSANNGSVGLTGTLSLLVNQAAYITVDRNASFSIANLAAVSVANIDDVPLSENTLVLAVRLASSDVWLWDGFYAASGITPTTGLLSLVIQQNENLKLVRGGVWGWDLLTNTLSWTATANVQIPSITEARNTIPTGSVVLASDGDIAYVEVNRSAGALTNLTVSIGTISTLVSTLNTVIIARRLGNDVLVGNGTILLKDGEFLELDGALADINRRLTQLKLHKHETAVNKARILGADFTQLDQDILSQVVGEFILSFTGAVINFTSGAVLKEDDATALGVNFTPFTIPVGQYYWYGVSLIPSNVLVDNRQEAQVQIDFADSANAVQASAPIPVITGDIKLGAIQVQNIAGVITIVQTRRLGVGSGSGSGTGDASLLDTLLRDRFAVNSFELMEQNIFRRDKATKVLLVPDTYNAASTGAYSPAKRAFSWTAAAQTLISIENLDQSFLDEGVDLTETELYFTYLAGFVDPAAIYQVSRDGGLNYQTVTMSQAGLNAYRGYHVFSEEPSNQALQTAGTPGAGQSLTATTRQQLSSPLVLTKTSVVKTLDLNMNYGGAGVGYVTLRLVKNNAGVPSTAVADILSESDAKIISTASLGGTGNITVTFNIPDITLVAGTYHIVLVTDAAYKAGTLDLTWRSSAATTTGATFDGSLWTTSGNTVSTKANIVYGRALDLRVKVISSVGTSFAEGYGVYYGLNNGVTSANGEKRFQKFYFTGDSNTTDFLLTFTPDPELLEILDPYRGQTYAIEEGVARIEGQTVKFAPDTFDFPGEDIVLIFRQTKGSVIDNSDSNAAAISEIQSNLIDIGDELASISDSMILPKVVPFTTIQNRAMIPDLSQDLKPRFAVDRMMTQQLFQLQDEVGANGEPVWSAVNDKFNQIRFVGTWGQGAGTVGPNVFTQSVNDYVEITFYGTGLNLLSQNDATARDNRATVDGGSEGANFAINGSAVLNNRNYSMNVVLPVVSNQTLGLHTVKIRNANAIALTVYGFEILNEQASGLIQLPPGAQLYKGKRRTHTILETTSYNSSFETGTLGTRGGRVLIYQKSDGSVAKAVTPTDTTQLNMTSANHANEEIARIIYPREFGAGRTALDDFSTLASIGGSRAFTLDDGTTTLICQNHILNTQAAYGEGLGLATGAGDFFTLSFVGTGLDLTNVRGISGVATYTVTVDGTAITTATVIQGSGTGNTIKIVSGLPYGNHAVKVACAAGGAGGLFVGKFIIYQPKTPTLPTNAVEIGAYNIMATFVANTVRDNLTVSTGTLRKHPARENVYVGAWSAPLNITEMGIQLTATAAANNVQHTFYGTGIDLRCSTNGVAVTWQFTLTDNANPAGTTNLTAAGATTAFYGANITSFTGTTGTVVFSVTSLASNGLVISGLPLGWHTIKFAYVSGTGIFNLNAIDDIVPIHSPKDNGPFVLQNTLPIGSQGIADLRKFSKKDVFEDKNTAQAVAVSSGPTSTSTGYVPMPDMSVTISVKSKTRLKLFYTASVLQSTTSVSVITTFYINGIASGVEILSSEAAVGQAMAQSNFLIVQVAAGVHKIDVYWKTGSATMTAFQLARILSVEELE